MKDVKWKATPLEDKFHQQLKERKLTRGMKREVRFAPPRKWRWDFCWPALKIAVEINGGTWRRGGHTTGKGYENDMRKYQAGRLLGWLVIPVTSKMVDDLSAIDEVEHHVKRARFL